MADSRLIRCTQLSDDQATLLVEIDVERQEEENIKKETRQLEIPLHRYKGQWYMSEDWLLNPDN